MNTREKDGVEYVRLDTAEKYRGKADSVLRLAQHLASEILGGGRCKLIAIAGQENEYEPWSEDYGRCPHPVVALRWEDGFADEVCEQHADEAEGRGAIVVRPLRHDGTREVVTPPGVSGGAS